MQSMLLRVLVKPYRVDPFINVHMVHELGELLERPVDPVQMRERMNPVLLHAILLEDLSV
jgi:hypothetical protein